jgi:hypothetical protein
MPPKHGNDCQNGGRNHDEDQSRIFEPRDGRNAERHDQSQNADLPGKDMYAGRNVPSASSVKIAIPVASALKSL